MCRSECSARRLPGMRTQASAVRRSRLSPVGQAAPNAKRHPGSEARAAQNSQNHMAGNNVVLVHLLPSCRINGRRGEGKSRKGIVEGMPHTLESQKGREGQGGTPPGKIETCLSRRNGCHAGKEDKVAEPSLQALQHNNSVVFEPEQQLVGSDAALGK